MDTGTFTYHVVALGSPGSGKTVYLSALHHVLGDDAQAVDRWVTATVDEPEKRSYLTKAYNLAVKPDDQHWPAGTHSGEQMREFVFTFRAAWTQARAFGKLKRHNYPALSVSYVDYAGEWIPEGDEQSQDVFEPFKQRVKQADALLGIIDGLKLLQFMTGHPLGASFMNDQLRPIVAFMEDTDAPLHFIITKWDIFSGSGFTLEDVRAKLLDSGQAGFRKLIESRTAHKRLPRRTVGTVRLIPVTAVGGLALLQDDWTIAKNSRATATQLHVEIPLVAAVYDICDREAERLREGKADDPASVEATDALGNDVQRAGRLAQKQMDGPKIPDVKLGFTAVSISLHQIVSFVADSGQEAVRALGKPAVKTGRALRRTTRRVRARGIEGVTSPEAALYYVMRALRRRLRDFEDQQPNTTLDA
jgi:hypothetical protein